MCDNKAVVQVVTALSSKDPTIVHLLRCMHFSPESFNILIKAKHVAGVQKTMTVSHVITCRCSENWPH